MDAIDIGNALTAAGADGRTRPEAYAGFGDGVCPEKSVENVTPKQGKSELQQVE